MSNIVEVVASDKNLTTMSFSVKTAGLEPELNKTGPFTVFAPTEIAFGKLHEGELSGWLKPENRMKLTGILNGHVVEGKTTFKDFRDGQKLITVSGEELFVKVNGSDVTVNGVSVQGRDKQASNGVVHSIAKVMVPLN